MPYLVCVYDQLNLTVNTVLAMMWCLLELNLSIIGGNLPTMKSFVKQVFPNLLGSSYGDMSNFSDGANFYGSSNKDKYISHLDSKILRSTTKTKITSTLPESGSEEYIMHDMHQGHQTENMGHIKKTVEYHINYDNHSQRAS
jgi:hypothetical protein